MKPSRTFRRRPAVWLAIAGIVVVLLVVFAKGPTPGGTSDDRLYAVSEQLKCLQCVGESVASSQSPLARQFRDEIRDQMADGASDEEILSFFRERYGDEVLLTPDTSGASALIWVLPLLVVGAAGYAGYMIFRRRSGPVTDSSTDPGVSATLASDVGQSRNRRPVVVASVIGFVVVMGGLLWWGASDRGSGNITGDDVASDAGSECRTTGEDLESGIECWSGVLESEPDNVEALTYRGWLSSRSGDPDTASADLSRALELDPSYSDALVFSTVLALDEKRIEDAQELLARFHASDPPAEMLAIADSQLLDEKVYLASLSAPARECWLAAAEGGLVSANDPESLAGLGECASKALEANPDDVDLQLGVALAGLGGDKSAIEESLRVAQRVTGADPGNADALSIALVALVRQGKADQARSMLEAVEAAPRAPAAWVLGDAEALGDLVESASTPEVPNPDGG